MDLIITILPVVTKDLPISPRFTPYNFLSRCKFSTLTTRQPMVEFYLLTFPRFPLRKKEHKSCFGKNRTHDFRTSRCTAYLLDHSGDEATIYRLMPSLLHVVTIIPTYLHTCMHTYTPPILSVSQMSTVPISIVSVGKERRTKNGPGTQSLHLINSGLTPRRMTV